MTCTGCNNKAKYLVHEKLQPHCEDCMLESLCSAPTMVIDLDSWEEEQNERKQRVVA